MSSKARRELLPAAPGGLATRDEHPELRKYRHLAGRIDKAKAELLAWQAASRFFALARADRLQPLMAELAGARRQRVLRLADLLEGPGFNAQQRDTLARCLCEEVGDLVGADAVDQAVAAELEALHDRYAPQTLAQQRRDGLADMKRLMEEATGVDLGDAVFETEEALLQHARLRLQSASERARADAEAGPDGAFGAHAAFGAPQRQTASQRKRAQKQADQHAQAQAHATQSVREVFRKLASALHPDRAADDIDRARRTALMQRVNQAYEAQDLLTLFALQLEIEQIDTAHLAQAGTDKLRHYNRVLGAQLGELLVEIEARRDAFSAEHAIEPWVKLNPRKLDAVLEEAVLDLRLALQQVARDLQQLHTPAGARKWITQERKRH